MKRYDVVVPKKYMKDGEEKTAWKNVGTMVKFEATEDKPEAFILELNMFPEVDFKVFEQKPKEEKKDYGKVGNTDVDYPAPADENVPF